MGRTKQQTDLSSGTLTSLQEEHVPMLHLCMAIVENAASDYKNAPACSRRRSDAISFFKSEYCDQMLAFLGFEMNGQEVLEKLKRYYQKG